jgi:hypothetical protein
MKQIDQLQLTEFGVSELEMSELQLIEGGKFWDSFLGKCISALILGFCAALGARAANEL